MPKRIPSWRDPSNTGSYSYNLDSGEPAQLVQRFYFFSDIEGQLPFMENRAFGEQDKITRFRQALDTESLPLGDVTPKKTGELDSGVGFCFLGDLVDHGRYSVQLLYNMIEFKEENPDRVVLILGNRDLNKLRMADEQSIVLPGETKHGHKWVCIEEYSNV